MPTDEDLFLAIADNNLKKVKCLIGIEEGLSYTGAYDYGTPLFHSVESGYSRIVQYLLDNKYCFIDEGDESSSYRAYA